MKGFVVSTGAQRDNYRVDLECPSCGRKGTAEVSEEDYPFTDNRRFSVDKVTPGFSVQNAGSAVTEMEIACGDCGISARPRGACSTNVAKPSPSLVDENSPHADPLGYFRRR